MSVDRQVFKDLASSFVTDVFADLAVAFIFQSLTRTPDGQGGFTAVWSDFASVTGFVEKKSGGKVVETTEGMTKIDDDETFTFQFQFTSGITNGMRIRYGNESYNIQSVKAIQEADIWLVIEATKGEPT
jgi:SPP1 family predicted phage head-tail adaptor